ncbi:hypothetical protein CLOM_g3532, partial [Closterium sp. NIES-68]
LQAEKEEEEAEKERAWMREAVGEARRAAAEGEVPVGAVMVLGDDVIVARAHNLSEASNDPTAHAEMLCIRAACSHLAHWRRLQECTLYVTLEPCPMCAGAILQARVGRLVWGAPNPLLGADGSWVSLFPTRSTARRSSSQPVQPGGHSRGGRSGRRRRRGTRWRRGDEEQGGEEGSALGALAESAEGIVEEPGEEGGPYVIQERKDGMTRIEVVMKSNDRAGGWERAQGEECVGSKGVERGNDSADDGSGDEKSTGCVCVEHGRWEEAGGNELVMEEEARVCDDASVGEGGRVHPFHPDVRVTSGVLQEECAQVMRAFFRERRRQQADARRQHKEREGAAGISSGLELLP